MQVISATNHKKWNSLTKMKTMGMVSRDAVEAKTVDTFASRAFYYY